MSDDKNSALIPLGHVAGAYGLKGEVRVSPLQDGEALLGSQHWFFTPTNGSTPQEWQLTEPARRHGSWVLAHPSNLSTKEEADKIRGTVSMLREDFPAITEEDEHWAVDVVGCECVNKEGVVLGRVAVISTNGIQDILEVEGQYEGKKVRYLIPMVENYLVSIDTEAQRVTVDWQADWS